MCTTKGNWPTGKNLTPAAIGTSPSSSAWARVSWARAAHPWGGGGWDHLGAGGPTDPVAGQLDRVSPAFSDL